MAHQSGFTYLKTEREIAAEHGIAVPAPIRLFDLDGIRAFREAEAAGETRDVRVDDDPGLDAHRIAEDDVGGLASDTG